MMMDTRNESITSITMCCESICRNCSDWASGPFSLPLKFSCEWEKIPKITKFLLLVIGIRSSSLCLINEMEKVGLRESWKRVRVGPVFRRCRQDHRVQVLLSDLWNQEDQEDRHNRVCQEILRRNIRHHDCHLDPPRHLHPVLQSPISFNNPNSDSIDNWSGTTCRHNASIQDHTALTA